MGALTSRFGHVEVAAESDYGDGEASSPDDALFLVEYPDVSEEQETVEREAYKSSRGGEEHANLDSHVAYSFSVRVGELPMEDGAAPSVGVLLVGGGCKESLSGAEADDDLEAKYEPQTTGHGSLELHHYLMDRDDGDTGELDAKGCRHNWTLTAEAGNDLILEVEGEGLYAERESFSSSSLADSIGAGEGAFKVVNITATINSTTYHLTEFSLSPNLSVERDDSLASSALGQEVYLDASERAGGSINPKADASDYDADDFKDDLRAAETFAIEVEVEGENSKLTINVPAAQAVEHTEEADGTTIRHGIDYACTETGYGDDDDFTLTWAQT